MIIINSSQMNSRIEVFDKKKHNRNNFDCGNEMLTSYLKRQANQDMKRKLSACFVITEKETKDIIGYYTLSNHSIPSNKFPENIQKKLPNSYQSIPSTLLGRLAIDNTQQGQGLGKILLIDALIRSYELSKKLGSFAVIVDPIDKNAEYFYAKYDFIKLPSSEKMFIAMKTVKALFKN